MEATFEESFRLMKEERRNCVSVLYGVISKKNRKPEEEMNLWLENHQSFDPPKHN